MIDSTLYIDSFEHECVILKGLIHSERLKQHMVTIVVDQLLSNSALYEHKCLLNIKKLYKYSVKCDDQQHYKDIIEADMVSTSEGLTDNIPLSPGPYVTVRNPSASKSLHQPSEVFYFKYKTAVYRSGGAKSRRKSIRAVSMLWYSIKNSREQTKKWTSKKKLFIIGFYNILRLFSLQ